MRPYAVQVGDITKEHLELHSKVCKIVQTFQNHLTCHDVCSRLVIHPQLHRKMNHVRGWFVKKGIDHSWLTMKDNELVILDAYPWATGSGPIILTTKNHLNPWRGLYIAKPKAESYS